MSQLSVQRFFLEGEWWRQSKEGITFGRWIAWWEWLGLRVLAAEHAPSWLRKCYFMIFFIFLRNKEIFWQSLAQMGPKETPKQKKLLLVIDKKTKIPIRDSNCCSWGTDLSDCNNTSDLQIYESYVIDQVGHRRTKHLKSFHSVL